MKKREPIFYDLAEKQKKWLKSKCCPICGLPKDKWHRRKDWRCCSVQCTLKFHDLTYVWQYFRIKAFERDNYTCVKCGKKPTQKTYEGKIIPDSSKLVGDHIIPIAIGGDEYDLDNVQTLCIDCDKDKTKKDQTKIAKQRRIEKVQKKNKTLK